MQAALYQQLVRCSSVRALLSAASDAGSSANCLSLVMDMRKLCNHPDLLHAGGGEEEEQHEVQQQSGIKWELAPLFPPQYNLGCAEHSGAPPPPLSKGYCLQKCTHVLPAC